MVVDLVRPSWVGWLVLLIPVWWWHRRSLVDFSSSQRKGSLTVRAVIVVLLVGAVSGLLVGFPTRRQQVVFLVDRSASIDASARESADRFVVEANRGRRRGDRSLRMYFAEHPGPAQTVGESLEDAPGETVASLPDRGTDIHLALGAALANLIPGLGSRIVLCTDGQETGADPAPLISRMRSSGHRVDIVPVEPRSDAEVQLTRVLGPGRARVGEPFPLEIHVRATAATPAQITVFVNGIRTHTEDANLEPGENLFSLRQIASDERILRYSVEVRPEQDTFVDNNSGSALVRTAGRPSVLLIEARPQDARHLRWALESEDIGMEVRSTRGVPTNLADLRNYDALCFSDVAATDLSVAQMEMIRAYVRDLGGGFLMLGGEDSFGLGGYYKSVLEEILPVRVDFERERESPSLAMVLVIDKSGSMGGEKLELAKEAAKAAAELLDEGDQLGVIAFDGSTTWVCEIHSAADVVYIVDRISSLRPGGGTNMGPALAAAFNALELSIAKLKHVLVLTDGHSTEADFYDLVTSMRSAGITVSSVGVGQGADQNLLEQIAIWGEGRYYFTADALSIPQIFAKETLTASRAAIQETPFAAHALRPHQVLQGIDLDAAPFLLGYVVTRPKPTGELVLATETGDPLLAFWRFGLGRVGAFTSDAKNRWAAEWIQWPAFSRFWAQVLRDIMRQDQISAMSVTMDADGENVRVVADVQDDAIAGGAADPDATDVSMTLVGPDLQSHTLSLQQTSPGRYEASFAANSMGDYHVQLRRSRAGQIIDSAEAGYARGYPEELRLKPTDEAKLRTWAKLGGGRYDPPADAVFGEDRIPGTRVVRLWPYLVSLAMLLLLLDIALRRIDFGG